MRPGFTRLTGVVVFVSALIGLSLSIYGIFGLWSGKPQVASTLTTVVDLSVRSVDTSINMLAVVSDSLDQASSDLALIQQILADTASTLGETNGLVDTTGSLLGEDIPQVIQDTQVALTGVQSTARVIDDILGAITRVPLLGPWLGKNYAPEVPLATSVTQVNQSLDPLPDSLIAIQHDMEIAGASLETVQGEIDALARQIGLIDDSIQGAGVVVEEYRQILDETSARLDPLQTQLPGLIDTTYVVLTIVLVWIVISQVGALLQAIHLLGFFEPARL